MNSPCSGSLCCGWPGSAARWSQHCPAGGRAPPSGRATSAPSPWSQSWTSYNTHHRASVTVFKYCCAYAEVSGMLRYWSYYRPDVGQMWPIHIKSSFLFCFIQMETDKLPPWPDQTDFEQKCVPEQSEVGGSLWEAEVVVLQTVVLLQQNGHGAWMGQVELLKLLPLDTEGLPTLQRPVHTDLNCGHNKSRHQLSSATFKSRKSHTTM